MKQKYFFIINRHNKKARTAWRALKKMLDAAQVPYRSHFTEYQGHAVEIAKKISYINSDEIRAIVAVGGDGTINEVANGISEKRHIPLTFVSGGSGNDIIRGLYKKRISVKQHFSRLKGKMRETKLDLGKVKLIGRGGQPRFFVSAIGIGLDGEVSKKADDAPYKKLFHFLHLGTLSYVLALFSVLPKYKPREVSMQIDGADYVFSNVWLVAAGNLPYYGGGMKICPDADPSDGLLELCIVHDMSWKRLLLLFITVFSGSHIHQKGVTLLKGRQFTLSSDIPMMIHADGEHAGTTPVEVSAEPTAARLKL
ncbi:diacylglycerol/lipid kinase family protein [Fictibacillus iocasae]|uniref:Diacylglycerol/lipid kinase family protein n=1 Tax=Fictibacillus iocasae TaxID=2715437 RepID=A0ABW2NVF3_9BACL